MAEWLSSFVTGVWNSTHFLHITGKDHAERIERFYRHQSHFYDETRKKLLLGREVMLSAAAQRLRELRRRDPTVPLVWVDIGGGTGYNVETMMEYLELSVFDQVYIVDISPSLCAVAQKRALVNNWKNVQVICMDATKFTPDRAATLVTFSYSLSMIPDFHTVLDVAKGYLSPQHGLLGVCDFYVSHKYDSWDRQVPWHSRVFWRHWFEFSNVDLSPERRGYAERGMSTLFEYNGRNHMGITSILKVPYYIYLGHVSSASGVYAPRSAMLPSSRPDDFWPHTYIYNFTWEDPREDHKILQFTRDSKLVVIGSAGCNVLDYALSDVGEIHSVDMNPAQTYLLELKIAAARGLEYEDFWMMFGLGWHPDFAKIFRTRLAPYLSQSAYDYWVVRQSVFNAPGSFFYSGGVGWFLWFFHGFLRVMGLRQRCIELGSSAFSDQFGIYQRDLKPTILGRFMQAYLNNTTLMWLTWGVPKAQLRLITGRSGSLYEYACETLDSVCRQSDFTRDNYFYQLCLRGYYTEQCCPRFLKREHFAQLKTGVNKIQVHCATIETVLQQGSFTHAIMLDHLDWRDEVGIREELSILHKHMTDDCVVIGRSAGAQPWYMPLYTDSGFKTRMISVRGPTNPYIDRVNMYASFYLAVKDERRLAVADGYSVTTVAELGLEQ